MSNIGILFIFCLSANDPAHRRRGSDVRWRRWFDALLSD
jgi:hypothetical protein